jgi:hypothetical protein
MKYIIIIAALLIAPSALAVWGSQIWGVDPWDGDKEDNIFFNGFEDDPPPPDLVVTDPATSTVLIVLPDESLTLSATVRNQGGMVSAESTIIIYRSDANIILDEDLPMLEPLEIESLAPGSESPQSLLTSAP